jgi:hypothetical protein
VAGFRMVKPVWNSCTREVLAVKSDRITQLPCRLASLKLPSGLLTADGDPRHVLSRSKYRSTSTWGISIATASRHPPRICFCEMEGNDSTTIVKRISVRPGTLEDRGRGK